MKLFSQNFFKIIIIINDLIGNKSDGFKSVNNNNNNNNIFIIV